MLSSYQEFKIGIPTLSSATVKKCYNILTAGFAVAKKWRYVTEIPETTAPVEKTKKRKAWDPGRIYSVLEGIKDDKLLHLAVHIAFVCSLRAGETAGIDVNTIDFHDRSIWITQEVQRVSDQSLFVLPKDAIIRMIPKQIDGSNTSLILKNPKTEGSIRKVYLTKQLCNEIQERLNQIQRNKDFYEEEYHDYSLLICWPNGQPIEPRKLLTQFKTWQMENKIETQIDFHGLRQSGQMHKIRLSQNNYQLVAESAGHSPQILLKHYNEIWIMTKESWPH